MEAADTRRGFRLGDWVIRPDAAVATGPGRSRALTPDQLTVLLLLAARPEDAVPQSELRDAAFAGDVDGDARLQATLRQLRELLGGSADDRHYIVHVGHDAWALVADITPLSAENDAGDASVPRRTFGGRLQHFITELRRRSVLKVGGAYLLGMWIMLQVAEVTFEPLHFPQWWMTALTILAVLGLPIVVVLAWSYEITPGGIVLDSGDGSALPRPRARRAIAPALVAGVTLMTGVTGYAWWRSIDTSSRPMAPQPGEASVAVLPLVDMSPTGGITYLADGLTEELSAALAQIPGLRVAARTSAFEFKGRAVDVRRIGEALGVRHVLEGSVRRDGDRLRVTVQLIDAASGYHVWARSYDRSWSDVIAIQADIARSVTEALKVVLAADGGEAEAPAPVEAPDVRALDPYLAGLALMRKSGDLSVMEEAESRFREAIDIAPGFARAHAGLCRVRIRMFQRTRDDSYVALAEAACRRALELDPGQLETEKGLADLYLASGRNGESEAICRQLVARYPSDADGHLCLGAAQRAAGHLPEAERSLRAAVHVEPSYWVPHSKLGGFLFEQGRADEAIAEFREVTRLTPSSSSAYSNLGAALQFKGDDKGAEAAYKRAIAIEPSASALSNLGTLNYFAGRYDQAVEDYRRATAIAARDQEIWGNLGDAYWQLGQHDEALAAYRQAIELATRDLEKQPNDPGMLSRLGYYHGRLGDPARADDYLHRAEAVAQDNPYSAYYRAIAAADRGDDERARALASRAAELGYPEDALQADPALKKVLGNTRGGKSR